MKWKQMIPTHEAKEIQRQLSNAKHERARQLLQSKLRLTYIESFVDLENNRARIGCNRDFLSEFAYKHLERMRESILQEYESIKNVEIYGPSTDKGTSRKRRVGGL